MIAILIVGHANFASGISSALKLVAGEQQNFGYVDFLDGDSVETLENKINEKLETLDLSNGAIIFADLIGGSPFKSSVQISQCYENVHVIGGSNLPIICEIAVSRTFNDNITELLDTAIETGRSQIALFRPVELDIENSSEDGI